jgi:hypothetical protein
MSLRRVVLALVVDPDCTAAPVHHHSAPACGRLRERNLALARVERARVHERPRRAIEQLRGDPLVK